MKLRIPQPGKHRMSPAKHGLVLAYRPKVPACACCDLPSDDLAPCESCGSKVCDECSGPTSRDMDGDPVGETICRECAYKNLEDAMTWEDADEGEPMSHIEELDPRYQATC